MINPSRKGKCGELEFSHYAESVLAKHTYKGEPVTCRRGQQYCGSNGDPDVVTNLPCKFEVKRTERFRLYPAVQQILDDQPDANLVAVAHRANRKQWVAVVPMEQFLLLLVDRD